MKFELKNIGPIKEAEIEVGNLTLICGKNNTGKTYLLYTIYGFLANAYKLVEKGIEKEFSPLVDKVVNNLIIEGECLVSLEEIQNEFNDFFEKKMPEFHEMINDIFNVNSDFFTNTLIQIREKKIKFKKLYVFIDYSTVEIVNVKINEDRVNFHLKDKKIAKSQLYQLVNRRIRQIIVGTLSSPFILPVERVSTRLFLSDIDENRSNLIDELLKNEEQNHKIILSKHTSRFAQPIKDNLSFNRSLEDLVKKNESLLWKNNREIISFIEDILQIEYVVKDGKLMIYDTKADCILPHYTVSTSSRSLADLFLWLKHRVTSYSILFIDEPELSLHPGNQIKIARLFAKLVNAGIKVFITTHSDYIVKELNNLVMLSNDFPNKEEFMKKYGYEENDVLKTTDIKAYIAENGTATAIEVDKFGMVRSTFDEAIEQINEVADELSYQFAEDREEVTP